jgi:Secretion system C-terminal sorting domain
MKKSLLFAFVVLAIPLSMLAQNTRKRVLLLGNSYTNRNDLPLIISNIASSMRDTFLFDSHAPNSHTLLLHTRDATTLSKIAAGNWDFVVLQEQSQRPALDISEVETRFFAPVKTLDNLINQSNVCGETMLYMTWGRKNGDSENCGAFPPVCTYEGMDSLLQLRYRMAADNNKAALSPVGAVWRHIRKQYPNIELYNPDESHPSISGSYAAALCFYVCFFRKNPTLVNFNNGLTATEANNIKMAVKTVVFDRLQEWLMAPAVNTCTTSIQDQPSDDVRIFPNPVTDKFTLEHATFDKILIFNNLGQEQAVSRTDFDYTTLIDFSDLATGQYWLILINDGRTITRKIVKQ